MSKQADDILRLTHCPRCGYDLEGLPCKHTCPDCEYPYDETISLIWVWDEEEEPRILAVLNHVFWLLISLSIFLGLLWFSPWNVRFGVWFFILISGIGSLAAYKGLNTTIRNYRLRDEHKAADALVFAPYGFLIKQEGFGQWESWDKVKGCKFRKLRRGRWRLRLRSSWWRFYWKVGKTFIIKATPRQAAAIRSRIRWCMKVAKK